jgi:ribose transport system ATP-binding protein
MHSLLGTTGIGKTFSGTEVLSGIDFELAAGECVAIIGENGAGKSTFAKILAGVITPDAGEIRIRGEAVTLSSPRDALAHGIAFIPQELAYVPDLTVAENVLLGRWPSRMGWTSRKGSLRAAQSDAERLGIRVDLTKKMSQLKLADQQAVEILKALSRRATTVILDEPTAPLSAVESEELFRILRGLTAEGVGIVYISHRMDEVHALSNRIDVFRNGRQVASVPAAGSTREELIAYMLGRAGDQRTEKVRARRGTVPMLELRNWTAEGLPGLRELDLSLWRGEVVGVFGVRGSGTELLAEGLSRGGRGFTGELYLDGRRTPMIRSPLDAKRAGLGYLPADRKHDGLVMTMSVQDNLGLLVLRELATAGFVRRRRVAQMSARAFSSYDIRARSQRQPIVELSGGNQQKVLLASRLAAQRPVLVLHEPTRGVDVGARVHIHKFLRQAATQGAAVLVISSDVEEAVAVADRLLIVRDGRLVGELGGSQLTQSAALRAAAGVAA